MDKREYRYFMTYDQDASGAAVNTKNVFVTEGVVCDVKISLNLPVTSLEAMILMNKENLQSAHIQINIAKKTPHKNNIQETYLFMFSVLRRKNLRFGTIAVFSDALLLASLAT